MDVTKGVKVDSSEVKSYEYNRDDGIIGWMDGDGSNLARINEQMSGIVRLVATTRGSDHPEVNARERAREFGVPLAEFDLRAFEEERGIFPGDYYKALRVTELSTLAVDPTLPEHERSYAEVRAKEIGEGFQSSLTPTEIILARDDACTKFMFEIQFGMNLNELSYCTPMFAAGGMALLSEDFVNSFYILNVHPGDLTMHEVDGMMHGKRNIVGDGWRPSARAISAGHEVLRSSTHGMIHDMDAGPVYMRGYGLPVHQGWLKGRVDLSDPKVVKSVGIAAQETLKHIGDHVIAGATFHDLFEGNWGMHNNGMLAYRFQGDWYLTPNGILPEDHKANNPTTPFQRDQQFIDEKVNGFYQAVDEISRR